MALYTIHVTEEDIREGSRYDCVTCPVARALRRILGRDVQVRSYSFGWHRNDRGEYVPPCEYPLPEDISNKIQFFDATGKMEPFHFTVGIEL
jgi:hypothetical protein